MFIRNFVSQTTGQVSIKSDNNECLDQEITNKHVSQHFVGVQITEEKYGGVTHS